MPDFNIRSYQSGDRDDVYDICLKTGDSVKDASHQFTDPLALGHIYAGPYMEYEPQSVFILNNGKNLSGYIMGTMDSKAFYDWMYNDWFQLLRNTYTLPSGVPSRWSRTEKTINIFFTEMNKKLFEEFPAHLHIDLLPIAQGKGQGKLMMDHYISHLVNNDIKGVHLELSITNKRAFNFYKRYGMSELERDDDSIFMGLHI